MAIKLMYITNRIKVAKIAELNPDQRFYGYTKVVDVLNNFDCFQ